MSATMELVLRARDLASDAIKKVGDTGSNTGKILEENWLKVGAAMAGAGAAVEALARKQAPFTEQTRQLATSLNMTEGEMRDLAISTSNVTFPLEDVLDVMERGRQQGIRSADQLQKFAEFWDMVGDASGESATELSEAGVALRAVGVAAGEEAKALDAFGYITRETTGDIGEFLYFLERTGPELREMGMDVDDAAAIMGILEHEFGMTARTARQEFRSAVNEADGDLSVMLETLGITNNTLDTYTGKVQESSGVIAENAEIHGQSYTTMQKFQHRISELTYQYGGLIEVAGNLSMVMIAAGPIIKGVSVAKAAYTAAVSGGTVATTAMTVATKALAVAQGILLSPVFLITAAIAALTAAGVLLYKNWDTVREKGAKVWSSISNAAKGPVNTMIGFANGVIGAFERMLNSVAGAVNRMPRFEIPSWVPGVGGRSFGLPRVPTASFSRFPTFHQGGQFRAPTPGGEGLALLRDREYVTTESQARQGSGNIERLLQKLIEVVKKYRETKNLNIRFEGLPDDVSEDRIIAVILRALSMPEVAEEIDNIIYSNKRLSEIPLGG